MLLGVLNGVVELRSGTYREGRREDYITKQCPVIYDAFAACPEWLEFHKKIAGGDEKLIGYKKRLAGLFLTGLMAKILFIPYGDGSNGKTTEHETYQAILGDQAADASLLLARKETSGPTPEIVALKNKRVIFINETREGARLNEARVKYLTGNDTICARGLHQDPINFRPTHKVVMRTNHKPIIRGVDKGIWRRIHLIPHMVTIEDSEAEDHYRKISLSRNMPAFSIE